MKGTILSLANKIFSVIWAMLVGIVGAWVLFYLADLLLPTLRLEWRGEMFVAALFEIRDSLAHGPVLYMLIGGFGGIAGLLFGIFHIIKQPNAEKG